MTTTGNGPATTRRPDLPASPQIMPASVRAGQVVGLVEVTGGLGSVIDVSRLADELGADIATLLPILDTAEMLGLVTSERGDVALTEFGLKFQKTAKNKLRLLKDVLSKTEPFKTALEIGASKSSFSAQDVSEALLQRDIRWHHRNEINESLIQALLIHWAIYGGLLNYNGKSGKFQKI
ncbi:MAG: AAA-associated domain-containing protein [Nitrososphaerales archaeon]